MTDTAGGADALSAPDEAATEGEGEAVSVVSVAEAGIVPTPCQGKESCLEEVFPFLGWRILTISEIAGTLVAAGNVGVEDNVSVP